jgi:hypothetical protein
MTNERLGPPQSVPTLTEVVSWPRSERASGAEPVREPPAGPAQKPVQEPPPATPLPVPGNEPPPNEDQLTERILLELQRQVDLVLDYRVREVLTPILARAADALVRDARAELTRLLRDVVARSVAEELRRQRSG